MAEWAADLPGKLTIDIKGAGGCSISEGGSMANLITGGLSIALMSADSSAKAALKPMNMVSRELHKRNPDLELIERAGTYGGMKLDQAEESLEKAREELKEAQEAARQEEKAEREIRLEEKAAEKAAEREAQKAAEQAARELAVETTAVERVQSAGGDPNMQGTGDAGCVVPGRYDADMDKICVQLAQERSRMEVSLSGDFEAGGSAGKEYSAAVSGRTLSAGQKSPAAVPGVKALIVQKYRAAAFRDQVSRMRMDLKG